MIGFKENERRKKWILDYTWKLIEQHKKTKALRDKVKICELVQIPDRNHSDQ